MDVSIELKRIIHGENKAYRAELRRQADAMAAEIRASIATWRTATGG